MKKSHFTLNWLFFSRMFGLKNVYLACYLACSEILSYNFILRENFANNGPIFSFDVPVTEKISKKEWF